MKFTIEISEEELKKVALHALANDWDFKHTISEQLRKQIEESLDTFDMPTLNKMVTEFLVARHLGKMREDRDE
jgi:hypothetical protein